MQSILENEYTITPGSRVKGVTWFVIILFICMSILIPGSIYYFEGEIFVAILMFILFIAIFASVLGGSWAYSPKKYLVSEDRIRITRPVSNVDIPIKTITNVEDKNPDTFKLWKVGGNDGLFSITGSFYNKEDGKYRMYAKNKNYVMLHTKDKKYVLSPDEKVQFIIEIKNKIDKYKKDINKK